MQDQANLTNEQTVEEKLIATYTAFLDHNMEPQHYGLKEHQLFQQGMLTALKILGMKVPGIND
ncbi:hypothetical protein [Paenibacillus xylanexedens]|uniref:hypothetical protein n=1 Tax=Paenibacillus xylanexedens TaxID=528191 RepID=UPI0011A34012|nr:hypothetical protein [Paenibacillus xylanexedens]